MPLSASDSLSRQHPPVQHRVPVGQHEPSLQQTGNDDEQHLRVRQQENLSLLGKKNKQLAGHVAQKTKHLKNENERAVILLAS
jgi:hypothetical protein